MSLRQVVLALAFLVLPASAVAQDIATPTPTPTPTPTFTPITPVQSLPNDFRLDPGEGEPRAPTSTPSANVPVIQPLPEEQETSSQNAGGATSQPNRTSVDRPTRPPAITAPGPETESDADIPSRPSTVEAAGDEGAATGSSLDAGSNDVFQESGADGAVGGTGVFAIILGGIAALVFAVIGLLWWRRREANPETVIDRPAFEREEPTLPQAAFPAEPPPAPRPDSRPPQHMIGSLVNTSAVNPATIVSTRPRGATISPTQTPPQSSQSRGLVTTNLAAKRRAEAEALERARQEARQRQAPARPKVNQSVSFDWS